MSAAAARSLANQPQPNGLTALQRLRLVREVLLAESTAIHELAATASQAVVTAAEQIAACRGAVVVTGIGKAGLIGQKVVATLASTGSPAHFLHPAEAIHGDLGRVGPQDLVWVFSYSGRSEEVLRLLPVLKSLAAGTLATTSSDANPLGSWADTVIAIGQVHEACSLGLAPSTSTTLMLASGDAVALLASRLKGFTAKDFARFHPGGSLGRKLSPVEHWMRPRSQCRIASQQVTVRDVFSNSSSGGRRSGAVMLVDDHGQLSGLFTDSDLARLMETRRYQAFDEPIAEVMTRQVQTIPAGSLLATAIEILAERKISELPVLDSQRRPVGLLDITDIVAIDEPTPAILPLHSPSS